MKALWVSQLWQDLYWEPLYNKQRELSFEKGHAWRASSQWRLDGYPSFEKTSTGNPYITSSENYLLGKATHGGPQASEGLMGPVLARPPLGTLMPELFLLVLPLKARTPLGTLNLVLLACLPTMRHPPRRGHCISSACCSTTAMSAKNDKR